MTTYIQRKDRNGVETVDEFETRKEACAMLAEYRLADCSAIYYLSSRPCKAWREASQPAAFDSAELSREAGNPFGKAYVTRS
jgi:hypothetical protein